MPYPLSSNKHRHRAVKLEFDHLRRSRVTMSTQVADEPPGCGTLPRPEAVAHPRCPLNVFIRPHVVDQRDESVVQHGEVATQNLFGGGDRRTFCIHELAEAEGSEHILDLKLTKGNLSFQNPNEIETGLTFMATGEKYPFLVTGKVDPDTFLALFDGVPLLTLK